METCDYNSLVAAIPGSKLKGACSKEVLLKTSRKFARWRDAAPYLNLDLCVVDAVDQGKHDEEGKRYVILCRWKQLNGPLATNENLIRSFLAAGRADLAEDVASELRGSRLPKDPRTTISDMPHISKPFSAVLEGTDASASRDIPPSQPTTVGPGDHQMVITPQTTTQPHQRNLLVQSVLPEQSSSRPSGLLQEALVLMSDVPDVQVVKKDNITKLLLHMDQYEKERQRNEQVILDLSKKICQFEAEREKQMKRLYDAEIKLESKENQTKQLQDDVYQKKMELKQKQSEMEDFLANAKREHQATVIALERELKEAKLNLQSTERERKDMERQFKEAYQSITKYQREAEKVKKKVRRYKSESIELKGKLEQAFLDKEKEEVEKLEKMLRRHREVLVTYRFLLILVLACIVGVLLQNMGVFP